MDPVNFLEAVPILRHGIRWLLERKLEVTVLTYPEPRFYSYHDEREEASPFAGFGLVPPPRSKTVCVIADFRLRIVNNRHDRPIRITKVDLLYQRRRRRRWRKPTQFITFGLGERIKVFDPAESNTAVAGVVEVGPVSEKVIRVHQETSTTMFPPKRERLIVKLEVLGDVRRVERRLVELKRFY